VILNNLTIAIITLYTLGVIGASCFWWVDYLTLTVFFLLGFGFFVTGLMMMNSLKKHFPQFFKKMGCVIFAATLMLTIPLEIRALNWFLQNKQGKYA